MHLKSRGLAAIARKGLTIFLASILVFDGVPTAALAEALDAADAVVEEALVEEELPEEVLPSEGLPEQEPSDQSEPVDSEEAGEPEALPEEATEEEEPVDDEREAPADQADGATPSDAAADSEEDLVPEEGEGELTLTAQADGDLLASGEWGECGWSLDREGLLRVWPTDGVSGRLADSSFPWHERAARIVVVNIEPGVVLPSTCDGMFRDCSRLTTVDVSEWDTSSVSSMADMFYGCSKLSSLDVSGWDTALVADMTDMFSGCSKLSSLDVSGWDTSSVTGMSGMFEDCSSLSSLDVSGWDTSSVSGMSCMFKGCSSLTELDVSGWDTSSVLGMAGMFWRCSSLASLDLSDWDTSSVVSMGGADPTSSAGGMFQDCSSLVSVGTSGWDTSSVTNMESMFSGCASLASLDTSSWDTSSVTNMGEMFWGCSSLASLDVSGWDTSSAQNMIYLFCDCSSIQSLDVSGWDVSSVDSLACMFDGCSSLTSLDVSEWDTHSVWNMNFVFRDCSSLASLDVSDWETGAVECMPQMFSGCSSLETLDPHWWDTSSVWNTAGMFEGCSSLTTLDLSGWDTSKLRQVGSGYVGNIYGGMFEGCSSLVTLDLSGWDLGNMVGDGDVLKGCVSLVSIDLSGWNTRPQGIEDLSGASIDSCSALSEISVGAGYCWGIPSSGPGSLWWSDAEAAWLSEDQVYDRLGVVADTYRRLSLEGATLTLPEGDAYEYSGGEQRPMVKVVLPTGDLREGVDYTVSYSNNVDVGTASFLVTGIGGCFGTASGTFAITRASLADASIAPIPDQTLASPEVRPDLVVTLGGRTLSQGVDYDVAYSNNTGLGTATATVTGKGNYEGVKSGTFRIVRGPVDISEATIQGVTDYVYTGSEVTQDGLLVKDGDATLVAGVDYTVAYKNNVNAGTATVTVTGRGNYAGTRSATFRIAAKPVSKLTVAAVANKGYTGSAIKPALTVKDGTKVLKAGTDYDVAYKNNVKVGTATVTITGKGNYSSSKSVTFKIVAASVAKATVSKIANQKYDGKAKTPSPTVKVGTRTLKKGTDYTLTYKNNQKAGTATVTIKGKGNYTGTKSVTFKIVAMAGTWKGSGSKWWYQWKDGSYPKSVFLDISGKTYYFNASGYCVYGWQVIGGKDYYFESSGAMAKSKWVGNYYLKADGTMARNEWVDGGRYHVDKNGKYDKKR